MEVFFLRLIPTAWSPPIAGANVRDDSIHSVVIPTRLPMRAALLIEYDSPLTVTSVSVPDLTPAGAVVRVDACGVCRSDWHVWKGDWRWRMNPSLPHILGHEVAGEVVAVGREVRNFSPGMKVTLPFHLSCGHCSWCESGQSNLCDTYTAIGFSVPGGFAELINIPNADETLFELPSNVSPLDAAALGCRVTSAFHGIVDKARLMPGETLAVFGCGGLGLAAVQIGVALGASVIAVDRNQKALDHAAAEGALPLLAEGSTSQIAERVRDMTSGGADVTIDALGSVHTLTPALESLKKQGRHLQLGLTGVEEKGLLPTALDSVVKRELSILGSVGCPRESFETLLALVESCKLTPARLISSRIGLGGIGNAFLEMSDFRNSGFSIVEPRP
jgi:D-arabinose 1-dehydrogenase-like Zn-dependent alcohol dehydrogenase